MVNPQNYFWNPGTTLDDLQPADIIYNPKLYRRKVLSSDAWKRLLSGQVDVWRVAKILKTILSNELFARTLGNIYRLKIAKERLECR